MGIQLPTDPARRPIPWLPLAQGLLLLDVAVWFLFDRIHFRAWQFARLETALLAAALYASLRALRAEGRSPATLATLLGGLLGVTLYAAVAILGVRWRP